MSGLIKFLSLFLFINSFLMEAQKIVKVETEHILLVFPDTILVRINILSNKKFKEDLFEGMGMLNKQQLISEIDKLHNIKTVIRKKNKKNELFDFHYIEVYDIGSYNELKNNILKNTPSFIEKIKVNDFDNYEVELKKIAIEKSRKQAEIITSNKGWQLGNLHEINEIKPKKIKEINHDSLSSHNDFKSILKQTFNEFKYKGYLLNKKGEIILKKKFKIEWFVKQ